MEGKYGNFGIPGLEFYQQKSTRLFQNGPTDLKLDWGLDFNVRKFPNLVDLYVVLSEKMWWKEFLPNLGPNVLDVSGRTTY